MKPAKGERGKADRLFSKFIRERANGVCQRCGEGVGYSRLQCAHIISRRYSHTRVHPDNAWALDAGCHMRVDQVVGEKWDLVKRTIGETRYWELWALAQSTDKFDWTAALAELHQLEVA